LWCVAEYLCPSSEPTSEWVREIKTLNKTLKDKNKSANAYQPRLLQSGYRRVVQATENMHHTVIVVQLFHSLTN
jgi:hypothetical protein